MQRIGRYDLLEELGRGSMGAVWKARDPQIDRIVAIKLILTANLSPQELEQFKRRFQREAQAAGRMSHPGIVTVYDISEDAVGQPYLVMEYVEGTPLDQLMAPGAERLPFKQALEIGIQVAHAVDYAHHRGVTHRDIKPANILVTSDGRAKITDFGIAKLAGTQLTQTGHLLGTPAFMSPEQFSGASVDGRCDIFSLGAVLYWMCTGEKPFAGDTFTAVSFKIVYTTPIPARQLNPSLPAELDTILDRCLGKNPDDRYPTGAALAADLEAIQADQPIAARPMPSPPVGETMAMPGARRIGTGTALLPKDPAARESPYAKTPMEAAGQSRPGVRKWLQRFGALLLSVGNLRRHKFAGVVTLALVVVAFGVGYWFWTHEEADSPAAASSLSQPKPASASRSATSGRVRRSVSSDPEQQTTPVASSRLHVVCEHNFRSASLEIDADGEHLLQTALRGEEQKLGVIRIFQGRMETSAPIGAGRHILRVRVSSPSEGYEDEAEISGTFSEGGSRTLLIEFGKGSALGVVNRRLTLSWR